MEALGGAASVIAVIQITASIVGLCSTYINGVKDAKEDIESLQNSVQDIQAVLKKLRTIEKADGSELCNDKEFAEPLKHLKQDLEKLQKKLDPSRQNNSRWKLARTALQWPLDKSGVEKLNNQLERHKSTISMAIETYQTSKIENIDRSTNIINEKLDLLELPCVYAAEFNSFQNQHEDYCLEGTRTAVRERIRNWSNSDNGRTIFWLNGSAGTGKSTISRTVARTWHKDGLLGASFFIKREDSDRGNSMMLFPTLARQLATGSQTPIPDFEDHLCDSVKKHRGIGTKGLQEQFEKLLFEPLSKMGSAKTQPRKVVLVIDALDEFEAPKDIELILDLLPRLGKIQGVRIKIFLTSRPEREMRLGFSEAPTHEEHEDFVLHRVPPVEIRNDLTLFFKDRLAIIRKKQSLPHAWPGDEAISLLVDLSTPLFIVAATASRWLEDWQVSAADDRLQEILDDSSVLTGFDRMYSWILDRCVSHQDERQEKRLIADFRKIFLPIVFLETPLTIESLSGLLGVKQKDVSRILEPLHSILHVPSDHNKPIRAFHLSLRDYLGNSETEVKSKLWINPKQTHQLLWKRCVVVFKSLKKNICNLSAADTDRSDIADEVINKCIPAELKYSCRYWATHLMASDSVSTEAESLRELLKTHFLHWYEAMSILGHLYEVTQTVIDLQSHISAVQTDLFDLVHELYRFVLENSYMVDKYPLQLYTSALVFLPPRSQLRRLWDYEIPKWAELAPTEEYGWGAKMYHLEQQRVRALNVSPDSRLLATLSSGKEGGSIVRIWNTWTKALQLTIMAEELYCDSIAFSEFSQFLVAADLHSGRVIVWNAKTGAKLGENFLRNNRYISFRLVEVKADRICEWLVAGPVESPDSIRERCQELDNLLGDSPSGAYFLPDDVSFLWGVDRNGENLIIWKTSDFSKPYLRIPSAELQRNLDGKYFSPMSLSPDNRIFCLSTGYDDTLCYHTFCLTPLETSLKPLEIVGHPMRSNHSARGMIFSHDSSLVAVLRWRSTEVWDIASGKLKCHFEENAIAIAFSRDGQYLVASDDKGVTLWELRSADQQVKESRHEAILQFSPDGQIVSEVVNSFMKFWDVSTLESLWTSRETDFGSDAKIQRVLFSRKMHWLAMVIWDNGCEFVEIYEMLPKSASRIGPLDDCNGIKKATLEFSPDERLLAVPGEKCIKIWDVETRNLQWSITIEDYSDLLAFSCDNSRIAAARNRTVRVWAISAKPELLTKIVTPFYSLYDLTFSDDNSTIAVTGHVHGDGRYSTKILSIDSDSPEAHRSYTYHDNPKISKDRRYRITKYGHHFMGNIWPGEKLPEQEIPGNFVEYLGFDKEVPGFVYRHDRKALYIPPELRKGRVAKNNIIALKKDGEEFFALLKFH